MASNWTIDRRTFRVYDSPIERADALRRQLSRLIVGCAEYRPDPLVVKQAGYVILHRKPTHAETQGIAAIAQEYTRLAANLPDRLRSPNREIETMMCQGDHLRNHGRTRKALVVKDDGKIANRRHEGGSHSERHAGQSGDGQHHHFRDLGIDSAIERDLLAQGGWSVTDLPTGAPDGRPPISGEAETRKQLAEIAPLLDLHHAIKKRKHRNEDQARLYRALPNALRSLSPRHAARSLSVSESTVKQIKAKSGADEVTQVLEELRALRAEMAEVREDAAETRRVAVETAERIRERFPMYSEIVSAVDELIASVATS